MDDSQIERLFKKIVSQEEYPGDVCPTERNLARFVAGMFSAAERTNMANHLKECSACREATDELAAASEWFDKNKAQAFQRILDRAGVVGVEPWASCPSEEVLEKYLAGAIPNTDSGRAFRERMSEHLDQCARCRRAAEATRAALPGRVVIKLDEIAGKIGDTVIDAVREMLRGLQIMAMTLPVAPAAQAARSYRGPEGPALTATMLDHEGSVVLDDGGHPKSASFDVIRMSVADDGQLLLDLATGDRELWEHPDGAFLVTAVLRHENRRLLLPAEKISIDGRVAIVGGLVPGVEIRSLPPSAVELTVVEAPGGGSR